MKKELRDVSVLCKAMRERYGLSAAAMSKIYGFGINQWRLYEEGEPASTSNYNLIFLTQDPESFKKNLMYSANSLPASQYKKAIKAADEHILRLQTAAEAYRRTLYRIE